jgi:hypothetical protein
LLDILRKSVPGLFAGIKLFEMRHIHVIMSLSIKLNNLLWPLMLMSVYKVHFT